MSANNFCEKFVNRGSVLFDSFLASFRLLSDSPDKLYPYPLSCIITAGGICGKLRGKLAERNCGGELRGKLRRKLAVENCGENCVGNLQRRTAEKNCGGELRRKLVEKEWLEQKKESERTVPTDSPLTSEKRRADE